jgi:microsomal dipeptidase-like Zn-dependent dipeptidase
MPYDESLPDFPGDDILDTFELDADLQNYIKAARKSAIESQRVRNIARANLMRLCESRLRLSR